MIIYEKDVDDVLEIPCGLGPVICEDTGHDLQMKQVDSSTELQHVEPDEGYFGLYRVIVNPYELDSKAVNSSTETQTVTSDRDGLSSVTVNPYTVESQSDTITVNGQYTYTADSADALSQVTIDVSIKTIPDLQAKTVDSSTVEQNVEADSSYDGLSSVTVNPYTLDSKTVNSSTSAQTVISDADGLSSVTVNPYVLDSKTVNPSTNQVSVTSDEDGLSSVTVNAVTAAIDPDIIAGNIRKDVEILGVIGTFEGGTLQSKTVNSSTSSQTVTPDGANYGLSSVTVNPYSVESKSDTITVNGQYSYSPTGSDALSGVTIDVQVADIPAVVQTKSVVYTENGDYTVTKDAGYDGMSSVDVSVLVTPVLESAKTVNSSTTSQTVTYDNTQYDGLSSVTVNPYTLENKTVNSSTVQQSITATSADGLAMVTVNPYTLDSKTVDASTVTQTVTSSNDGLSSVTVNPYVLDSKTVDSSTVSQTITSSEDGLSSVIVNPYTLQSKTIQNGSWNYRSNLTVTPDSSYNGLSQVVVQGATTPATTRRFNPTTSDVTYDPADYGYDFWRSVTVKAVTASIDPDIQPENIKAGVNILGVNGTLYPATIQNYKAAADITLEDYYNGTYIYVYPDRGYDGMYKVKAFGGHNNYVCTRLSVDSGFMQHVMVKGTDTNKIEFYSRSQPSAISAGNSGYIVKDCSYVEEIGFYYFYSIDSNVTLHLLITNCPKLDSVRFDYITNAQGGVQGDVSTWIDPDEIQTENFAVGVNWTCLTSAYRDPTHNLLYAPGSKVKRVFIDSPYDTVTDSDSPYDTVTDSIYLEYSSGLNVYGVYNVLSALNLTVTGKSVTFASGLTVTDTYGGGLQQKYNEVVNAGWTINNLTILPYGS